MSAIKELYRFVEGDSDFVYTITSADTDEDYDGETYTPVSMGRDEIESKGELSRDNIKISLPLDNDTARKWFTSSLDFPLTVSIFSKEDDTVEIEFKGRLTSVAPKKSVIEFTFESIFTSLRRMGLRQRYQINCPHVLYGRGCGLDKDDFETAGTITDVTNSVITVPEAAAFADGYFSAGIFEDNAGNLRFILSHVGSVLTLIRPMNPLIEHVIENGYGGLTCRVFPRL